MVHSALLVVAVPAPLMNHRLSPLLTTGNRYRGPIQCPSASSYASYRSFLGLDEYFPTRVYSNGRHPNTDSPLLGISTWPCSRVSSSFSGERDTPATLFHSTTAGIVGLDRYLR
ncbi:hypothetical protein DFP72DRAFT_634031 [Ephemerocybe angulata]|uniref:Uncharacterized protein n=1 Tax=Ephemerocybe angulata TaxID=980116 RepID=A0A8H6LZS4_9AGAR|nr:hypothetical protein DFP72DRAFT_634031 [Tulosesus angulatus]